jgi:hypothetical protein
MMNVAGFDLSSRFVDIVLLDENSDAATWTRIELEGENAFERARDASLKMPDASWYDDHGVFLCAIERPFVRRGQDVIRLVQGCVLASLPRQLPVWEVSVSQWKKALGVPIREKPAFTAFGPIIVNSDRDEPIPQDAYDALGVALYARDLNAQGIAARLGAA